ncbi:outer membrane beta-barrel protein [Bradyrhizobium sp.]|uniref:outer membrane protein n=1 Tax=Bradyrhizobium sp. TaxID=376 RepID=UPI0025BF244F|nr:outer membrane beta-barrel protein [Bradyrhizobium sp.]
MTAVAAFTGSALAADLPARTYTKAPAMVAVVPTWTGCYIGGNVGAGWSNTKVVDEVDGFPIAQLKDTAVVGGGQIGCDYQFAGNWVIGVQAMADASDLKASANSPVLDPFTLHGSIPWFATATGRIGFVPAADWLLYAKGGGAWTHTNSSLTFEGVVVDTAKFSQSGWTAGAGAEWKVAANWSVFAEYNYLGFSDKVVISASGGNLGKVHQDVQTVQVGLNYRFNWGGPVVAKY